jgi:hypothetical protein
VTTSDKWLVILPDPGASQVFPKFSWRDLRGLVGVLVQFDGVPPCQLGTISVVLRHAK